jgi:hypothetical protein
MKKVHELSVECDQLFRKAGLIEPHECAADMIGKRIVIITQDAEDDGEGSVAHEGITQIMGGSILGFNLTTSDSEALIHLHTSIHIIDPSPMDKFDGMDLLVDVHAQEVEWSVGNTLTVPLIITSVAIR